MTAEFPPELTEPPPTPPPWWRDSVVLGVTMVWWVAAFALTRDRGRWATELLVALLVLGSGTIVWTVRAHRRSRRGAP